MMTTQATIKLLAAAGPPINPPQEPDPSLGKFGRLGFELAEILGERNGFYAYESALLVRPFRRGGAPLGLPEWNTPALWKGDYGEDLSDTLFFAEDAFGGQFCIRGGSVGSFNPEEGVFTAVAASLGEWASYITSECNFATGYPLAHSWQMENRPLVPGERLLPKTPFVLGGKFELQNLYACRDVEGMRFRALIANQIRNLPDGSQVVLKIIEGNGPRSR
jgi:hypothetical protein